MFRGKTSNSKFVNRVTGQMITIVQPCTKINRKGIFQWALEFKFHGNKPMWQGIIVLQPRNGIHQEQQKQTT